MAYRKILTEGAPALRRRCREVDAITPHILRLLDDMLDTMRRADGVGLAAPQVGVLRRVVVIEVEEGQPIELINPVILAAQGEQSGTEGCLSLPGRWGLVTRPARVTVRALDREGAEREITGQGLLARALCHEIDHLDGILYPDKAERMLTREEMEALAEENSESSGEQA